MSSNDGSTKQLDEPGLPIRLTHQQGRFMSRRSSTLLPQATEAELEENQTIILVAAGSKSGDSITLPRPSPVPNCGETSIVGRGRQPNRQGTRIKARLPARFIPCSRSFRMNPSYRLLGVDVTELPVISSEGRNRTFGHRPNSGLLRIPTCSPGHAI